LRLFLTFFQTDALTKLFIGKGIITQQEVRPQSSASRTRSASHVQLARRPDTVAAAGQKNTVQLN
jgi:hypothetical protein